MISIADVNEEDKDGLSALHVATDLEVVTDLVDRGGQGLMQ